MNKQSILFFMLVNFMFLATTNLLYSYDHFQISLLKKGHREWNQWRKNNHSVKINLRGADLQKLNLSFMNLWGADLRNANLKNAKLVGANISWADLRGADLEGADLRYAFLRESNLKGANLRYTMLRKACFYRADLTNVDIKGANTKGADFRKIKYNKKKRHIENEKQMINLETE